MSSRAIVLGSHSPADLRRIAAELMRLMVITREPVVTQELSLLAERCLERARALDAAADQGLGAAAE
jgi:predicted ABC-class ATPase